MLFSGISLLDEKLTVRENMYVGVKGDRIDYIGTRLPEEDYGEVYIGKGKFLMPGLFNAHSHSPMTLLRGYAENMALQDWLEKKVFPFEAKMEAEDIFNGSMLAIAEMVRFGTASFTDMYYMGENVFEAVAQTGIKCNFSCGVTCFDDSAYEDLKSYREAKYLIENCHLQANGRFKVDLSIHGEYTSSPKVVAGLAQHAAQEGLNVHIHLSETKFEHQGCKERHGKTPAKYFYDLGIFDSPTTAAHCVWLEDEDFDILFENGVSVGACPVSNMKLAGGFARAGKMFEKGINVAIGTDGPASSNNLNLFKDAYVYALIYKGASSDPSLITPKQVLASITKAGAKSQGREDCGLIKVGAKADIIVLDIDKPHMYPVHDMLNNLIYSTQGSDVCLNMVDGKVLYKNGDYLTLDIEEVIFNAQKSTEKILASL
ncbi:MAG TPA: amidohydrolase [Clostridiales bacterium]|nr:amidohydrolase [Clostridiales bacterium]